METKFLKTKEEIEDFLSGKMKVANMNSRLSMKGIEKWKKQFFTVCWDTPIIDGVIEIFSLPNLDQKDGVFTLIKKAEVGENQSRYKVKIDEIEEIILEEYN